MYILHNLCGDCYRSLIKCKMPCFALADHFYCGDLPHESQDLTWVKEMACAIYCMTAHVTHLYESSDDKDLFVCHGDTCAHEMNVISTATVLPHTVGEIDSVLTKFFVGQKKFNSKN